MYAIAAVGLLTMILSFVMMARPSAWGSGILAFASKPYFHFAEIASRAAVGAVLLYFAEQTLHPKLFEFAGYGFLAIGVFLLLVGAQRHRAFAVRSASFTYLFRPGGLVGLVIGALVVYSALAR
ncbi:hypothetical protein J7U46_20910 [Pelomonas sp. V22]|uniref:hypothetical protein n=1 Tax=Pelomonas sp. V22 TaxID=2822139 RepID=UPI0024A891E4|nr:hypothetical protein [Pelomonas sp. V22]MDI4635537.1 hypothetical protein [Pelomonas sp. V22]